MDKLETFYQVAMFNLAVYFIGVCFVIYEYMKREKIFNDEKRDQVAAQSVKVTQLSLSKKDTISRNILDHLKVGGPKVDTKLAINLLYSDTAIDKAKDELLKQPGGDKDLDEGAMGLQIVYNPKDNNRPVFSVKYAANKTGAKTVRQHSIAEEVEAFRRTSMAPGVTSAEAIALAAGRTKRISSYGLGAVSDDSLRNTALKKGRYSVVTSGSVSAVANDNPDYYDDEHFLGTRRNSANTNTDYYSEPNTTQTRNNSGSLYKYYESD